MQPIAINDAVPTGLESFTWTCVGTGVACPAASGNGAIVATVPVFPAGAQLVYSARAIVSFGAPPSILNTVIVTPQTNVLCAPSNLPPPCQASVPLGTAETFAVPLGGRATMLLLCGLLVLAAGAQLRRRLR